MNKKTALILSAFFTAFVLAGTGIVVMSVRSAQNQENAAMMTNQHNLAAPVQASTASAPEQNAPPVSLKVQISSDSAVQTAAATAPGATLLSAPELVSFQGTVAYEVSLDAGKVYVDAYSGAVLYSGVAQAQAQHTWNGEGAGEGAGESEEDERGTSSQQHQDHERSEEENESHEHDHF